MIFVKEYVKYTTGRDLKSVRPMIQYEFWRELFFRKIYSEEFGGWEHLARTY